LKTSEDISFPETCVEERTRKSLGHVNTGFVRPLIAIQSTGVKICYELAARRVVVDIHKLKGIQVRELSLRSEGIGTTVQFTLPDKNPLAQQLQVIPVSIKLVVDIAYATRLTNLVWRRRGGGRIRDKVHVGDHKLFVLLALRIPNDNFHTNPSFIAIRRVDVEFHVLPTEFKIPCILQ